MNVRIESNANQILRDIGNFSNEQILDLDRKFLMAGSIMVRQAKLNAPVDVGHLRRNINMRKVKTLHIEVYSLASYSAYVEFGTGIYSVKGNGRLTPWVYKSKNGYRYTRGSRPHPYFYKSYDQAIEWLKGVM
jgi:hypothetical protein